MEIVFIILIVVLILIFLLKSKKGSIGKSSSNKLKILHKRREYLTTENERKLFFALRKALNGRYMIHCQTSLIALVEPIEYRFKSRAWSKRMDFVITDTATKVLGIIELDDSTHKQKKRIERDNYVNDALSGHHTLIRLATQKFYNPEELAQIFEEQLGIESIF